MSEPEWDGDEIRRQVAEVLDGHTSYDAIGLNAQRLVREAGASRIAARREALDLEREFLADGTVSWSEADLDGNPVIRDAQAVQDERHHE